MANELLGWSPPGPRNVIVPGYGKGRQAELLLAFAINESDFDFNRYITTTNVDTLEGVFPKIYTPDRIRVEDETGEDVVWVDGRPVQFYEHDSNITKSRRNNVRWSLQRYLRKDTLGWLTIEQSPLDEVKIRQEELAMKTALFRGIKIVRSIFSTAASPGNPNTGAWGASRAMTAANLNLAAGGTAVSLAASQTDYFGTAGSPNPVLARVTGYMLEQVLLNTLGLVKKNGVFLVINPRTAFKLSLLQEVRQFLRSSPDAGELIRGNAPGGGEWVLPSPFFGINMLVDTTPKVIGSPSKDADTLSWLVPDDEMVMLTRPGEITSGIQGSPFSTLHVFQLSDHAFKPVMEDMGKIHQAVYVAVEDCFQVQLLVPESGWHVTNLFA